MTQTQDGGPAFPFAATDQSNTQMQAQGMSLRDWFAGNNMAAILGALIDEAIRDEGMKDKAERAEFFWQVSQLALEAADAMIAARGKP